MILLTTFVQKKYSKFILFADDLKFLVRLTTTLEKLGMAIDIGYFRIPLRYRNFYTDIEPFIGDRGSIPDRGRFFF
jgi:hypothetical protein